MRFQKYIQSMKALVGTFEAVGYSGIGHQGLTRCIGAFEAQDKDAAIAEYRRLIGSSPNLASALTDLDTNRLPHNTQTILGMQIAGVMIGMDLPIKGFGER